MIFSLFANHLLHVNVQQCPSTFIWQQALYCCNNFIDEARIIVRREITLDLIPAEIYRLRNDKVNSGNYLLQVETLYRENHSTPDNDALLPFEQAYRVVEPAAMYYSTA